MDDLLNVISKTFAADQSQLNEALTYLDQLAQENFPWLASAFVEIICCRKSLRNVDSIVPYKLQSVLQLKNMLQKRPECWQALDNQTKERIKDALVSCFQLDHVRLIGLSQVIHALAQLELPHHSWPDLIPRLLELGSNPGVQGAAAVQTVGYICESVNPCYLESYNNQILTLLVAVIRNSETLLSTKVDGMNALQNSLQFAALNFARLNERNQLMQVICEGTVSEHMDLRVSSLQCLCRVVSLYYPLMEDYLPPAVWPIAVSCVTSGNQTLILQGLEVINSVCEAEIKLMEEGDEETGWITSALPQLISCVTQAFLSAGPSVSLEWDVGQASQVTLRLMSLATGDSMLNMMMPTLLNNVRHQDVMTQSCVLMCISAVAEQGPSHILQPLIQTFLDATPVIIFNQSPKVRYHGGVALSQLCLHQPEHLHSINSIPFIISLIIRSFNLMLDPQVVEQGCWAVRYLAENLEERLTADMGDEYINLVNSIYQITILPANQTGSLEKVSSETLISCLEICPEQCKQKLATLLVCLLDRVQTLPSQSPALNYMCTAIDVAMSKVEEDFLQDKCSTIFSMFCYLLINRTGVQEDVMTILSTLLDRIPNTFLTCNIPHLLSLLIGFFQLRDNLTAAAIGLMSDVYRNSSDLGLVPNIEHSQVLSSLLNVVQDTSTDDAMKAISLGTVSDMLLCTESQISCLHAPVLQVLHQLTAASTCVNSDAPTPMTSSHQLVKSTIETYSTLIQVFHQLDEFKEVFVQKHADSLSAFITSLDPDIRANEEVLPVMCGVVGDLSKYLPDAGLEEFQESFQEILQQGLDSRESRIRRIAKWSRDQMPTVSGCTIIKKARIESDEMETGQSCSFRVSLSCSSSQYITQNIEETFTLNLGSKKCTSSNSPVRSDLNSNYVEATVHLPSPRGSKQPVFETVTADSTCQVDSSLAAVRQLRRLGKRRAANFVESNEGKKLRDEDDEDENSFW